MTTSSKYLTELPKYLILALLLYTPVFGFLDVQPIRMWDEARVATNAYEMYKNDHYFVTYFFGNPDMWNTKPPLLIWMQVSLMHLLGVNELAIRLPSAFAVFFTCVAILVFSLRYLKNFWLAFIAILLLITSQGFVGGHVARTGDYDALLTLFTTASCLFFFCFTETRRTRFLYLFFLSILLAAFTKGIAGLLFLPAFGLYALLRWQLRIFLLNKHFYIGLLSFLVLIVGYYFLRESQNPGYLQTVQENEMGGRYMNSQGAQKFDFWFYFNNFRIYRLPDRYLLIPFGFVIGLFSRNERLRKFALYLLLITLTFFLIISSAQTKLEWYDAPLYPFLSLSVAIVLHFFFDLLRNSVWIQQTLTYNVIPYVFLFLVFITPYSIIWTRTFYPDEYSWDKDIYEIGYYLKRGIRGHENLNGQYLAYVNYNAQNLFYIRILEDKGVKTGLIDFKTLKKGDQVIAYQDEVKNYIRDHYFFLKDNKQGNVDVYTISSRKPLMAVLPTLEDPAAHGHKK